MDRINNKMVAFYVRNALNTVKWHKTLDALRRLKIPSYLSNMICSYFEDRILVIGEEHVEIKNGCAARIGHRAVTMERVL